MNRAEKVSVCEMRLRGMSIYQIADALDKTPQSIFYFISTLPHDKDKVYTKPDFDESTILAVCDDYFKGITVPALANMHEISIDDIKSIFGFIAAKRRKYRKKTDTPYYPKITAWMVEQSCSTADMAKNCGLPVTALRKTIAGRHGEHMSYDVAEKISNYTGLSFSDIFAYQIRNEEAQKGDAAVANEIRE